LDKRIAHLSYGRRLCVAGFRSSLCRLGVRSVELVPFATFPLYPRELTATMG
jgi:hypothetical protein